jgi:hypothetical protein
VHEQNEIAYKCKGGFTPGPRPRMFTKSSVPIGQEHKLGPHKSMMDKMPLSGTPWPSNIDTSHSNNYSPRFVKPIFKCGSNLESKAQSRGVLNPKFLDFAP